MYEFENSYASLDEYSTIDDEKSDAESGLLTNRGESLEPMPERPLFRRWVITILLHATVILVYTMISFSIVKNIVTNHTHGPGLIYSPARDVIEYQTKAFNVGLAGNDELFGIPNPHKDREWEKLLEPASIHLTKSEAEHFHRDLLQLPDGSYFAQLNVYHELHCIKRLYQYMYPEYYFTDLSDKERDLNRMHNEHCLDVLRQGVMCHGDIQVITMRWGQKTPIPLGNFSSPHECINWDRLNDWATKRAFTNGLEPGVLVHPTLGPSFPKGYAEGVGETDVERQGESEVHIHL